MGATGRGSGLCELEVSLHNRLVVVRLKDLVIQLDGLPARTIDNSADVFSSSTT